MKYTIKICGDGYDLMAGYVKDEKVYEFLKKQHEEGEVKYNYSYEDGFDGEIDVFDYTNIYQFYGAAEGFDVEVYDENDHSVSYEGSFCEHYSEDDEADLTYREGKYGIYGGEFGDKGTIHTFKLETDEFKAKHLHFYYKNYNGAYYLSDVSYGPEWLDDQGAGTTGKYSEAFFIPKIEFLDLSLVEASFKKGDLNSAKELFKEAINSYKDDFINIIIQFEAFIKAIDNEDFIKELFYEIERKAKSYYDFTELAKSIVKNLDDKVWAKELYLKAAEKVKDSRDFRDLIDFIAQNLDDKLWAKELYLKAAEKAGKSWEFRALADSVVENLDDKVWAKELYLKAVEKAEDYDDFRELADSVKENLNDEDWAEELYEKAEDEAEDS